MYSAKRQPNLRTMSPMSSPNKDYFSTSCRRLVPAGVLRDVSDFMSSRYKILRLS